MKEKDSFLKERSMVSALVLFLMKKHDLLHTALSILCKRKNKYICPERQKSIAFFYIYIYNCFYKNEKMKRNDKILERSEYYECCDPRNY